MNNSWQENSGALLHVVPAGAPQAAATSGTQTGVSSATGLVIDRRALPQHYESCKVVTPYNMQLASGVGVAIGVILQHSSASGSGFTSLATKLGGKTKVGSTTTFNGRDLEFMDVNLRPAKRFLRFKSVKSFTTTAQSAAVTIEAPIIVFGGAVQNPAVTP